MTMTYLLTRPRLKADDFMRYRRIAAWEAGDAWGGGSAVRAWQGARKEQVSLEGCVYFACKDNSDGRQHLQVSVCVVYVSAAVWVVVCCEG